MKKETGSVKGIASIVAAILLATAIFSLGFVACMVQNEKRDDKKEMNYLLETEDFNKVTVNETVSEEEQTIEFSKQSNTYHFTPKETGIYQFDFEGLGSDVQSTVVVKDSEGKMLERIKQSDDEEKVFVYELKAEEEYTIELETTGKKQSEGYSALFEDM